MNAVNVRVATDFVGTRDALVSLARTVSIGALSGALSGFVVGGVLGRLGMRLLAVTSPEARGGMTDDQALVGEITLSGTANLFLAVTSLGALAGLVYLWVRRVLPKSMRGRVLSYGLFTGSVGGALFVHDHPSFDFTQLTPDWLTVSMFVALPLLFGIATSALTEIAERPGGLGYRLPWGVLLGAALVVCNVTLILSALFISAAIAVSLVPTLRRAWQSRVVTVVGTVLFLVLVTWGLCGIVADIISIATDQPSKMPFNP